MAAGRERDRGAGDDQALVQPREEREPVENIIYFSGERVKSDEKTFLRRKRKCYMCGAEIRLICFINSILNSLQIFFFC